MNRYDVPTPEKLALGAVIAEHRKRVPSPVRRGWNKGYMSQKELAREAGIAGRYVHMIEHGQRTPPRRIILILAEALDLKTSETDRLLFLAGYAPQTDYQVRCEMLEGEIENLIGRLRKSSVWNFETDEGRYVYAQR